MRLTILGHDLGRLALVIVLALLTSCSDKSTGTSKNKTGIKGQACLEAGVTGDLLIFPLALYNGDPVFGDGEVVFNVTLTVAGTCVTYDFEVTPGTYWLYGHRDLNSNGSLDAGDLYAFSYNPIVVNQNEVKTVNLVIQEVGS